MHLKYLGDSYDVVKQSLLHWLAGCGSWAAYPMFTHDATEDQVATFARILGVDSIFSETLGPDTDRDHYFAAARECGTQLFLDPDTGLCIKPAVRRKAPAYLYTSELSRIALSRPDRLTLVFDQSVPRGTERSHLERKLATLAKERLHSVAYVSHACFVLVGADGDLVRSGLRYIYEQSRLPKERFLECEAAEQPDAGDERPGNDGGAGC